MSIGDNQDRSASETVYLELSDGQSHKFYEVTVIGTVVTIRYGRIGTPGQSSDSTYATPEKAQAEATKKTNEKLKKGYVRVSLEADRPTSADQLPEEPAPSLTTSGVSSRAINLAEFPITMSGGRNVLKFPLQRSLMAVELIATCTIPTFTINLNIDSNIAYHFDVRSHQGQIVQNTSITGRWGAEERLSIPAEFTSGQPFTLRIAVEQTLVVYLNQQVLSRYADRLPANQIDAIEISYPSGNLQLQSIQVFEQGDAEIAVSADQSPVAATEEPALSQEPTPPPAAVPPLLAIDPTIAPPSFSLLNASIHRRSIPPNVAGRLLRADWYPLGFVFRELQNYGYWSIPLPRSIACFEIVGTLQELSSSDFTVRLTTNQDQDCVYGFDFQPSQGQMMQWSSAAGVRRAEERLDLPNTVVLGQLFHYVLVITPEGDVVSYVNNQPLSYHPQSSESPDKLHLTYNPSGLKLQQVRALEPPTEESQISRSSPAIAPPSPQPDQHPSPPQEITEIPPFLRDLPPQFEPLRSFFQQNLVPYIKIQVGEQVGDMDFFNRGTGDPMTVWQSKIGGNPYFPKTAEYPLDPGTGKAMPLLMQINCAEVPPIAGFDFPQVGILQFYLGFQPAEASATPGKYRVLYFPEISTNPSDLITDFSFIERDSTIREFYPEVYPIAFSASRDLFWESQYGEDLDDPEEFAELCEEFDNWIGEYNYEQGTDILGSKLGGYVDLHSDTNEIAERANGRLLLELIHPFSSDDSFLFFIPDEQLRDRDFSDVEFYFVCD